MTRWIASVLVLIIFAGPVTPVVVLQAYPSLDAAAIIAKTQQGCSVQAEEILILRVTVYRYEMP